MKNNFITSAIIAALSMPATAVVNIEWVTVGNPGNPANSSEFGSYKPGAVGYEYQIGKYEVTIGQYVEFLNNVAKEDPYGLWHPSMELQGTMAGISRSGSNGNYVYSTFGSTNRPIAHVSWFDAARFANWMQNGQGAGSTETGAYSLNGATSGIILATPGATIRLPTLDEWYKAAYYDPTKEAGGGDQYWRYATRSDILVSNSVDGNYFDGDYATTQSNIYDQSQNYLTNVGAYSNKASYYGTFDQLGNVMEWNDSVGMSIYTDPLLGRGISGGAWSSGGTFSSALWFSNNNSLTLSEDEGHQYGFRLVSVPVPEPDFSSWSLLATLPPDKRGPLDRNGPLQIQNLLAYAMALDPLTATANDLPRVSSVDPAAGHTTFRYRRAKSAPGVTLTPRTSTTLDGWQTATILQSTIVQDGGAWEVVDIRVPAPPGGKLFFQLQAQ